MLRDSSHFDRLVALLELERSEERSRLETQRKELTLQERQARGLTLLDVEPVEEDVGLGGRVLVTLERTDRAPLPVRMWPGELVEVRPPKAFVDHPGRAVVSRSTLRRVQIAFDRSPPTWMADGRLMLDIVPNDISFERAKSAVKKMAARDKGAERRVREVLLGNEAPKFDSRPPGFEASRALNPEQTQAVAQALAAQDFFLVHGPPGTGKSHVLAEVAVQAAKSGARILCTAASNAAVDHLLDLCVRSGLRSVRIGHPARVSPLLQQHTLDVLVEEHPDRKLSRDLFDEAYGLMGYARKQRTQGRSRERFANARSSKAEAQGLFDDARKLEKQAVSSILDRAQVICITCTAIDGSPIYDELFDLALIDEATQATEPVSLIPFLRAKKVVLAGDPFQLPPTILSDRASKEGLSKSLFERLLEDHGDGVKRMLKEQYRMNEGIMRFPSKTTYGGQLRAPPEVAARTLAEVLAKKDVLAPPTLFIDTAGKGFEEKQEETSRSLFNDGEAELILARVKELLEAGLEPRELAIISPYSAQARYLRERIENTDVEVDTVDAFQGREKDCILVSFVRSNAEGEIGFLADLRRLNVAITRPRRHLFLVGDSATLSAHPTYAALVEEAQESGGYRSAWEWP